VNKKCSQCKEIKDVKNFRWRKDQQNYRANCVECCSIGRTKYYKKHKKRLLSWHKKYRLRNRDKIIKWQSKNYYENDGAKQRRIWRSKNLLRDRKNNRQWQLNNPEKIRASNKKVWQRILNDPILHEKIKQQTKLKMSTPKAKLRQRKSFRKHFKANRSYYKNKSKRHYLENKTYYYIRSAQRRALKLKAVPKWANLEIIKEIYKKCNKGYHVDHIIPLQGKNVCGLHVENNLQYLKAKDNLSKGNNFLEF
jgi:hypothetical protein